MHLCHFNKEFLGLCYDFYQPRIDNYGIITFKLYRCKKCGRFFYEDKDYSSDTFRNTFKIKIQSIREIGYKPIGELIKVNS